MGPGEGPGVGPGGGPGQGPGVCPTVGAGPGMAPGVDLGVDHVPWIRLALPQMQPFTHARGFFKKFAQVPVSLKHPECAEIKASSCTKPPLFDVLGGVSAAPLKHNVQKCGRRGDLMTSKWDVCQCSDRSRSHGAWTSLLFGCKYNVSHLLSRTWERRPLDPNPRSAWEDKAFLMPSYHRSAKFLCKK